MTDTGAPLDYKKPRAKPRYTAFLTTLTLLIFLIILGVVGFGTYHWQHQKLAAANTKISAANSKIQELNASNQSLTKKNSSLQTSYDQTRSALDSYTAAAGATQSSLGLTVNGSKYVNPDGTVTSGGTWFGVNMTLTNSTKATISLTKADFKLKDGQNNEYPEEGFSGSTTLPSGWVDLADQTLAPGDKVRGVVIFQMPNDTVQSFTLVNGANTYPVSAQ